jgi:hypothetical protein
MTIMPLASLAGTGATRQTPRGMLDVVLMR